LTNRNPSLLHFSYLESRKRIISEEIPISFDQSIQFAALQMQITYKDYDPLIHIYNFLK
jgi:hypothetical protein